MGWTERTEETLRQAGYRRGAARRIVVSVLAREGCCVTVPEIVDAAQRQGHDVGLASVYRVLDLLNAKGLVHKIELG